MIAQMGWLDRIVNVHWAGSGDVLAVGTRYLLNSNVSGICIQTKTGIVLDEYPPSQINTLDGLASPGYSAAAQDKSGNVIICSDLVHDDINITGRRSLLQYFNKDGVLIWHAIAPQIANAEGVGFDSSGNLYVNYRLYGGDPETVYLEKWTSGGSRVWQIILAEDTSVNSGMVNVLTDGTVITSFALGGVDTVVGINPENGSTLWTQSGYFICCPGSFRDHTFVLSDFDINLYRMDKLGNINLTIDGPFDFVYFADSSQNGTIHVLGGVFDGFGSITTIYQFTSTGVLINSLDIPNNDNINDVRPIASPGNDIVAYCVSYSEPVSFEGVETVWHNFYVKGLSTEDLHQVWQVDYGAVDGVSPNFAGVIQAIGRGP